LSGYEKAISEAGLKIDEKLIVHGDYTQIKAESIVRQVLRSKKKFDGIFAANDLSAVGAIQMLFQQGISVPEQVKVIGFDDSPVATNGILPVTSIRQPIKELGIEVALSLLEILNGGQVGDKLLGVKLIKRKSTAT
jgi:DNA-binding LacI/PurR family transcriptional regulator